MTVYHHLANEVQPLVDLPIAERASLMLADRFIVHDRLRPIMDHVEFLRYLPVQSRAAGLVVYGQPGAGKTMLAKSILRRYPRNPASPTAAATRPVLMISGSQDPLQPYPQRP